jgi:hypothetical protein
MMEAGKAGRETMRNGLGRSERESAIVIGSLPKFTDKLLQQTPPIMLVSPSCQIVPLAM